MNDFTIWFHRQRLFLRRTDVRAVSAAKAIHSGYLYSVVQPAYVLAERLDGFETCRRLLHLFIACEHRPDRRVRAYEGTLVALQAGVFAPLGQVHGYAALLIRCGSRREGAVRRICKSTDGQVIAFLGVHRDLHIFYKLGQFEQRLSAVFNICPFLRNVDFLYEPDTGVYSPAVHVHDVLAFALVCLLNAFLQVLDCFIDRDDAGQLEERRLHDHIDPASQADLLSDLPCVDHVEVDLLLRQIAFDFRRKVLLDLLRILPKAIEQECAAFVQLLEHIVLADVRLVVAGDEVRAVDQINKKAGTFPFRPL